MAKKDYYEILGLTKSASSDDIKKAYRSLAKKYHPDINKEANAEQMFKDINEAYEVLSDPNKKQMYDQYGHQGVENQGGFEGFGNPFGGFGGFGEIDLGDIFGSFFGGRSSRKSNDNRPRKGQNLSSRIKISFIDAVLGKTIEEQLTKHELCSDCKGTGADKPEDIVKCSQCNGNGQINVQRRTPLGVINSLEVCHTCGGNGKIIKVKCKTCKGQKYTQRNVKTSITIPAGINNGQEVIVEGFGGPGLNGGPSGDLIIEVYVEPHKYYVREQNNIHMDFPVSFLDIIKESKVTIPTPYGNEKIVLTSDLRTGDVLTLKEKGFKSISSKKYGDLKLHIKIYIPKMSKKEKEAIINDLSKLEDDTYDNWVKKVGDNK